RRIIHSFAEVSVEINRHEPMLSTGSRRDSLGVADLPKAEQRPRACLSEQRQVSADHGGDLGVTAGDRPIGAEEDWLAIGRYLDGPRGSTLGRNVGRCG